MAKNMNSNQCDYETSYRILYQYYISQNQPIDYQGTICDPPEIKNARNIFLWHLEKNFGYTLQKCPGCYPIFSPGQLPHMQPGGCLYQGDDILD